MRGTILTHLSCPSCVQRRIKAGTYSIHLYASFVTPIPAATYTNFTEFHEIGKDKVNQTLFVATDDYAVVDELRSLRPLWKLVTMSSPNEKGFVLSEWKNFTSKDKHRHFMKFLVELHAMANANGRLLFLILF